jgi:hypothetical protein
MWMCPTASLPALIRSTDLIGRGSVMEGRGDDIKAAIAAEVKRGELRQFYVKRVETGGPGAFAELNDEELQQAILEQTRELAELDPEFAKQLAQQKRAKKH